MPSSSSWMKVTGYFGQRLQDESETRQPYHWKATTSGTSQRQSHHLYFSMRHFGCALGEELEIYFSLYDAQQSRHFRYPPAAILVDELNNDVIINHRSVGSVKSF